MRERNRPGKCLAQIRWLSLDPPKAGHAKTSELCLALYGTVSRDPALAAPSGFGPRWLLPPGVRFTERPQVSDRTLGSVVLDLV